MKRNIETSVTIAAPADKVWNLLADTAAYPSWNPYIKAIDGPLTAGSRVKIHLELIGGGKIKMQPTILNATQPELRWKGRLVLPGLFDGEHYFRVEALSPQQTRFVQGENFFGILVPLVGGILGKTKQSFEQMNEALKKKAEN